MANHQAREGDSVDKTVADVGSHIPGTPISIAEQAAHGTTPYDKGGVAGCGTAQKAAGTRP